MYTSDVLWDRDDCIKLSYCIDSVMADLWLFMIDPSYCLVIVM